MEHLFYKRWLLMALKGILVVIFGIITLFDPQVTLIFLATAFGIYAIVAGSLIIISALRNFNYNQYWTHWFIEGIIDVMIGLLIVTNPNISASIFLGILAIWAILNGVILLFTFLRFRKSINRKNIILIPSVLSILFGLTILFEPLTSAIKLSYLIGAFAIVYGVFSTLTAIKLTKA